MLKIISLSLALAFTASPSPGKKDNKKEKSTVQKSSLSGLKFRSIGPSLTAGRIADIAVNPNNTSEYYLAVASGGVWKTSNSGNTYHPVFDGQSSYSIGCIAIDPSNENVIWVGTGENNNQRSVAYGDGVYRSLDGGKSWKNMGLKNSEHIGMIVIDPSNSNHVFVAAYGPLWSKGGERGLYETTDGGKTWKLSIKVDEHTGINEVHIDPTNSDIMYATAHQRRRHVFTYVGGGPGSRMYKSTNGGASWDTLTNGLPSAIKGRIGMDISPANPNYIYALVEAEKKQKGLYKSTDKGASWNKVNKYCTSGNYYQEVVCDPLDKDKVFFMDTWLHHTEDGGKTVKATGEKSKHVDNHCIWINPLNTNHWIVGCDGGVYETWDHAANWHYKPNLPITQFYKVALDNDTPFYNIYGGTQDNNSLGGPSRTTTNHGIMNSDWYITKGGDGFEAAIDPENPNIVYSQSQYGWLARYDKQTGENVGIKPMAQKGESALRWNWDAPLIISPHSAKRLYFAANKLFRSDNRGDSWKCISGDLSRNMDRNQLPVMGRVQSADAIMKNKSTTMFGNIVALDESPLQEDLIYVGSDDGLIHVSEDAGGSWKKFDSFKKIPEMTYVNALLASSHSKDKVYAVFNNHKKGDFKPYLMVSNDKGESWKSISSNLPERGSVYDVAEDHIDPNLLFVGTEFGVFFSVDGGGEWKQLKAGLPTIAVRDLEIQKRENDLVVASFGRGFYVLDDYSPLRNIAPTLESKAHIYPVKDALMYIDSRPLGLRGKGSQGESHYTAKNPPLGAVITYFFNDTLQTSKELRQKAEAKLIKKGEDVPYPSLETLRKEDREEKPYLLFTIYNEAGDEIRKMIQNPTLGLQRIVWDFRMSPRSAIELKSSEPGRYGEANSGPLALPGKYYVSMHKVVNAEASLLVDKTPFTCKWLENMTIPVEDKGQTLAFQVKVEKLRRAVDGSSKVLANLNERVKYVKSALKMYPNLDISKIKEVKSLEQKADEISISLYGDPSLSKRDIEQNESIYGSVGLIIWNMWRSRSAPTQTNKVLYDSAGDSYTSLIVELADLQKQVEDLENYLDENNVPYTPGRGIINNWKKE
ncbi:MAG: glycosyl hydrolase [Crocinitomicaceae bacterium]|nr:glycosyl hydrolase [Crocinitomicaceae bacterium]